MFETFSHSYLPSISDLTIPSTQALPNRTKIPARPHLHLSESSTSSLLSHRIDVYYTEDGDRSFNSAERISDICPGLFSENTSISPIEPCPPPRHRINVNRPRLQLPPRIPHCLPQVKISDIRFSTNSKR